MSSSDNYRESLPAIVHTEARPAHKFGHQPRLYALTQDIGADMSYDDDVVFAAVWLHDLGVFEGNRPSDRVALQHWNHVAYAAQRAIDLLPQTNFPSEKIPQVVKVIEEHQPEDTPSSLEAVIVRDADILEQLGAIAVMRTAAKLGSDTRFILFADAANYLRRQLNQLPAKLSLDRSKELAVARLGILGDFLDALQVEAGSNVG